MTIDNINVEATVARIRETLESDTSLTPSVRSLLEVLLLLVTALINRLGLNSRNSSKPPSSDPDRKRGSQRKASSRKPGGQPGHPGKTLVPFDDPDEVVPISIDRSALPIGRYRHVGWETRQVVDIDIRRWVTEYQAEVVENVNGERFVAPFPEGLVRPIQYGDGIKAHAVYLSQYQLLPFKRIEDYFRDQFALPISSGSLVNFNEEAGRRLEPFGRWAKQNLVDEPVIHADETGVNLSGKRHWLHCLSSDRLTLFEVHAARGSEAMDAMGVLPIYTGVAVHDHWSPYFKYNCVHAMCNAHHLRELQRAWEQDGQRWAQRMHALLIEINKAVSDAGGALDAVDATRFRARYRRLLAKADLECPPPDESQRNGRRGRLRRSKARNLLERLRNLEAETLRFMIERNVPFTNNMGERDIRMTKLQQKISGCFRSMEGASSFCRTRSYLSTCRKNGVSATDALALLFAGAWPEFINIGRDPIRAAE